MRTIEQLNVHELREHIIKNWMTHDGAWFFHCLKSYGIEEANRLNKAAIKTLAGFEFKRAKGLFGIEKITTFKDIREAIDAVFSVSKGDFMGFSYSFPEEDLLAWEWPDNDCFAYQGMKRLGTTKDYQCGVLYRVLCWLDEAGIIYAVEPTINGCLINTLGECRGKVRFSLPKQVGRGVVS